MTTAAIAPTAALTANSPWIPSAPATTPPAADPAIVGQPGDRGEDALGGPGQAGLGALGDERSPRRRRTAANAIPSSGAIATSRNGSVATAATAARTAKTTAPTTSGRPVPKRTAIRRVERVHDRDLDCGPDGPRQPDRLGRSAERGHPDRVERVRCDERGPHEEVPNMNRRIPGARIRLSAPRAIPTARVVGRRTSVADTTAVTRSAGR